jgi:tryptophan halogenase
LGGYGIRRRSGETRRDGRRSAAAAGQRISSGDADIDRRRVPGILLVDFGHQINASPMIKNVLVLGAGSAGLIAAISIKRKIAQLNVQVVRSPSIGVIGVGEATTPNFPRHLFEYLGIPRKRFYALAEPTWKLGIKFLWGPRKRFDYTFDVQLDTHYPDLSKPTGFYCDESFDSVSLGGALMRRELAFSRQPNGAPEIHPQHAFHIENNKFVHILEQIARELGVTFTDGKVSGAERGPAGIEAINLEDGQRLTADFFIDASGFRSELLSRTLQEPFDSFASSLFCDRAVIGGWMRGKDEKILPYTTAETMDCGWCWRIDHEQIINRGYVYCSSFISDDDAAAEFHRKNPRVTDPPQIVKFRSGCYKRMWVDNVIALGNSSGFVEPLESTAIMLLCSHTQTLIDFFLHSDLQPTETLRDLFNQITYESWQDIRGFLSVHYKFNGMLDTPFWKEVREKADVSSVGALLEFYKENGPTGFCRYRMSHTRSDFGLEGYLVMLVGNQVPYDKRYAIPPAERNIWEQRKAAFIQQASRGISSEEALAYVKHPAWKWNADPA